MKRLGPILLILCICLTGCAGKPAEKGFFAYMDAYLAVAENEEISVAVTLFVEKTATPYRTDKISDISFDSLDQIDVVNFSIAPMETEKTQQYVGYAITLHLKASESGIFKSDALVMMIDNSPVKYPIGDWVFDVHADAVLPEDLDETFSIWQSPAAGSNAKTFAYDYTAIDDTAKLKELWIGENVIVSNPDALPLLNVIDLPESMDAPIHFIRPKLVLDIAGKEFITFGMSYYSGAMNIENDMIEISRERNTRNLEV